MKAHHALMLASILAAPVGASETAPVAPDAAALLEQVHALGGQPVPAGLAQQVAGLPGPAHDALAQVLAAYLGYHAAAAAIAQAGPTAAGWTALEAPRQALADAALALREALPPAQAPSVNVAAPVPAAAPNGPVVLELACDGVPHDTYNDDAFLIVDACGDDTYRNNAGGTVHLAPGTARCDRMPVAGSVHVAVTVSAAVIDLDGSDAYTPTDADCGVNGGGVLGAGFLLDAEGDDIYQAGSLGVNGGGHLGSGFLLDLAGNDAYLAVDQGANGGAYVAAAGRLVDLAGDDRYEAPGATRGVNGGGYFGSVGYLADLQTAEAFVDAEAFACTGTVCTMAAQVPLADAYGVRVNVP
jgi:hypothetical protein